MRTTPFLLVAIALSLAACKPSAERAAKVDGAAEEQLIRSEVARWQGLVRAKDAAAIAKIYTDDGAVMPANAPIGKGHAAIEQTWASMMATPGFDLTIVPEQIIVSSSGDMALDRGTYRLTMGPGGTAQTDTGKYVVVWRKLGGQWKAAADIFNSDLPAAGG